MPTDKKMTTFGLSVQQIAELFKIGAESPGMSEECSEKARNDLFLQRLGEFLPQNAPFAAKKPHSAPFVQEKAPGLPEMPEYVLEVPENVSVRQVLAGECGDLTAIRRIKDENGKWSHQTDIKVEKDVAVQIYYAAIAAALVFHHRKITSFSFDELAKAFEMLRQKSWIPEDIRDLYGRAIGACGNPAGIDQEKSGR